MLKNIHGYTKIKMNIIFFFDNGKWMLFYDKLLINEKWELAKRLFRNGKLNGVVSMKCSTAFINPRASSDNSIIILYCINSSFEEDIMDIGTNILNMFDYRENLYIYYKTDLQTNEGTRATGSKKNHTYKLLNPLYNNNNINANQCLKIKLNVKSINLDILRIYPSKKQKLVYQFRYDKTIFDKLNEMNANIELQNKYNKWKNGINYITNKKITIGGKLHNKLKSIFMIKSNNENILFDTLNNINMNEYLIETQKINEKIDKENDLIKNYNMKIDNIIEKINNLKCWKDYIEFEGKKYGILRIYDGVHRENNCLRLIKEDNYKSCKCKNCVIWYGRSYSIGVKYYKCDKCNYKFYEK